MRVIAIDGPSGSGKTTLARALADKLALAHLDTGAMYRAVALATIRRGLDLGDSAAIAALAGSIDLEVGDTVLLDGDDVTGAIRSAEVTGAASVVAAIADVRRELVMRQRQWVVAHGGGVVEGRDIGSVVFPDAELKLYLVAGPEERARRRASELGTATELTAEEMSARDARDLSRAHSPLVKAEGAVEIDTTGRSVDDVVDEVLGVLDARKRPTVSTPEGATLTSLDHRHEFEYRPPTRGSLVFFAVCRLIAATVCRLFCRVTVENRENLPTSGPFVVAPVHRSYVDWIVLSCMSRRRLRFMAKDTLWKSRFVGWLLEALGTFPVHRASADRAALSTCVKVLQAGEVCVIFPEGQRRSGPEIAELFDGAAYVGSKAGVPVVPVGIGGSERVMQKGKILPRPYKVHIIVGRPLIAESAGGRVTRRAVKEMTTRLRQELQVLFDAANLRAGSASQSPS